MNLKKKIKKRKNYLSEEKENNYRNNKNKRREGHRREGKEGGRREMFVNCSRSSYFTEPLSVTGLFLCLWFFKINSCDQS